VGEVGSENFMSFEMVEIGEWDFCGSPNFISNGLVEANVFQCASAWQAVNSPWMYSP
jgi:hypothetical protein